MRHATDRERVPRNEDLFIAAWPDARLSCSQELGTRALGSGLVPCDVQVPVPVLEVRWLVEAVARRERRIFVRREQAPHSRSQT